MTTYSVAGCKFSIGTALDPLEVDFVAADFASIVWTEVRNWTDMGPVGDAAALITTSIIGNRRDQKSAGTRNSGSMANTFAALPTDAGQAALLLANGTGANYAFKVELNDKPVIGAAPKNSIRYFVGIVLSAQETGGAANSVRNLVSTVEINSNIVRVAASAS